MTDKTTEKAIATMVQRLVDHLNTDQIILFQFAKHSGTAGPGSDVDLFVVLPVTGSKREERVEMRVALPMTSRCPKIFCWLRPMRLCNTRTWRGPSYVQLSARGRCFMLDIDPHAEQVLHLVRQWVAKADSDLQNTSRILSNLATRSAGYGLLPRTTVCSRSTSRPCSVFITD